MEIKLFIISILISCLFASVYGYAEALTAYDDGLTHFQPMVAMLCGHGKYHNKYLNEQKQWVTDDDPTAICTKDKLEILEYCRKVYPKKDIRNIVESNYQYNIDNWKPVNKNHYYTSHTKKHFIKPIRCLEGNFQSDALLVPEHCLFDHIRNTSVCESTNFWNKTATQNCRSKGKILQNFAMLLPCGVGIFNGVEFVCCPSSSVSHKIKNESGKDFKTNKNYALDNIDLSSNIISKNAVSKSKDKLKKNKLLHSSINSKTHYDENKYSFDEDEDDDSSVEDEADENNENSDAKYDDQDDLDFGTKNEKYEFENNEKQEDKKSNLKKIQITDKDEEDEYYEDDYDEKDEDLYKLSSTSTTMSTTTTETSLEHYYSHFDAKKEHQLFKMAEDFLKRVQLEKMKKIFKNYAEFQNKLSDKEIKKNKKNKKYGKNNKYSNDNLDDNLRKTMEKRYENILGNLEVQNSVEKQQLNAMHRQRVLTLINMKKQEATDCYTNALNQYPLKTKKIQKCLEKLMKSLEKDRIHTLHHYKHLLMMNTKLALKEKTATLTHLENLIVIANRSISILNKYPTLNEKIRNHVIAFWHNLRGIPFDQVINRETERATIERYEKEIALKQQEKEHRKIVEEIESNDEKIIDNNSTKFKINKDLKHNLNKKQVIEQYIKEQHQTISYENSLQKTSTSGSVDQNKLVAENKTISSLGLLVEQTASNSKPSKSKKSNTVSSVNQPFIRTSDVQPVVAKMQSSRTHHESNYILTEKAPENQHLVRNLVTQAISKNKHAYLTLTIACVALVLATAFGSVLYCNNVRQSPISQGFVAVQQQQQQQQQINGLTSNDQQHVEALQINGYENPTYKYFEVNNI